MILCACAVAPQCEYAVTTALRLLPPLQEELVREREAARQAVAAVQTSADRECDWSSALHQASRQYVPCDGLLHMESDCCLLLAAPPTCPPHDVRACAHTLS